MHGAAEPGPAAPRVPRYADAPAAAIQGNRRTPFDGQTSPKYRPHPQITGVGSDALHAEEQRGAGASGYLVLGRRRIFMATHKICYGS